MPPVADQVYDILFNGPPRTAEEIHSLLGSPEDPSIEVLTRRLWFRIPHLRIHREEGDDRAYFRPNMVSNPDKYKELKDRFKRV